MGGQQEPFERVVGGLCRLAVQVERAGGHQLAAPETVPARAVQPGRRETGYEGFDGWPSKVVAPGFGRRLCRSVGTRRR